MTKEKQIPITLVTGLSDRLKSAVIKDVKSQNKSKVILYRDTSVSYRDIAEEWFIQENRLTEVVHDIEAPTKNNLLSIINEQNNKEIDQWIIDIEKFSNIHLIMDEDDLPIQKHIHIVDAAHFWFLYSSNDYIETQSFNSEGTVESSLGELLISPLEMANVILLGNVGKINHGRLAELKWFINKLNPLAEIFTMNDFKGAGSLFKMTDNIKQHTLEELYTYQLQQFEQQRPLTLVGEYGIDTYIYQSHIPISLERLETFFTKLPEGILRTKAICYHPLENKIHYISQIGPSIEVLTEEQTYFKQPTNKFLSEFLFIGNGLEPPTIKKRLDKCLLIDESPPAKELLNKRSLS
ncbi:G3E family GTPase [Evansella vedderi]|uniref:G3E family GTPase n=1 Tax=Evansella vedderi TaxID=38282 RepID=A0ABT9ZYL4_9BACI|nr:GTP-binding protein [Evansella vedderi]MDQ0256335.1 G3E family GTPase [Evansella vedderi]